MGVEKSRHAAFRFRTLRSFENGLEDTSTEERPNKKIDTCSNFAVASTYSLHGSTGYLMVYLHRQILIARQVFEPMTFESKVDTPPNT